MLRVRKKVQRGDKGELVEGDAAAHAAHDPAALWDRELWKGILPDAGGLLGDEHDDGWPPGRPPREGKAMHNARRCAGSVGAEDFYSNTYLRKWISSKYLTRGVSG